MDIVTYKTAITKDKLTSRAGLLLAGELMKRMGFSKKVNRYFMSPKSNRGYKPSIFVNSMILMLLEGGRCLDDLKYVKGDGALRTLLGLDQMPSSDTLGDWLRRQGKRGVLASAKCNQHLLKAGLGGVKAVTVDIDATACASEHQTAKMTYQGHKGYMPLIGTIAETGQVLHVDFRAGNIPPSKDNLGFIKQCQEALPKGIEMTALRSDAAGYQAELIDYCIDCEIAFMIRARMDKSLKDTLLAQMESAWQPLIGRDGKAVEGCSTLRMSHFMEASCHSFTLIVQRSLYQGQQTLDLEPNLGSDSVTGCSYIYRAIAVHGPDRTDSEWIHGYNQRGECSENRIKELKEDFAAGHLPCRDFNASALYFSLCVLAYNLFVLLRTCLPARFESSRAKSVRLRLFAISGKVVQHGRVFYFKLQKQHYHLLQDLLWRLKRLAPSP